MIAKVILRANEQDVISVSCSFTCPHQALSSASLEVSWQCDMQRPSPEISMWITEAGLWAMRQ